MLNDAELNHEMRRLAGAAVIDCTARYGADLDYSEKSLADFDRIVDQTGRQMHEAYAKDEGPSYHQYFATCMMLGAYLGEVIRRSWGGAWVRAHSADGPIPAVVLTNGEVYPTEKIDQRLLLGTTEDLSVYFSLIKSRRAS